jgi:hypothetical protein
MKWALLACPDLPDRFDGCDLSRAFGAAPLADAVMMVIFVRAGKRRFPRRD